MKATFVNVRIFLFGFPMLVLALAAPAFPQDVLTGTIAGRAMDKSGAVIPGVEVSVSSPAMIGGARNAVTDEQGTYRFTLLAAPGVYRVSFALPGFRTLNIEAVNVVVGATMTINATMEVGGVTDEVTVTSGSPTIDLEAAKLAVNLSAELLEKLPFQRDIKGIGAMVPGFYQTQFDVAGSSMGNGAGTSTRTLGRDGGDQVTYDGIYFSTIFPDFSSYEDVQISTAAKGAEAYNPGAAINFVIKSGGNDFHGTGYAAWQDSSFQSHNVDQKLIDRGFSQVGSNRITRYDAFQFDLGGPIKRDKLWFYTSYFDQYSGQRVPGFVVEKTGEPAVYYIRLNGPTLKLQWQLTDKMKLEGVAQLTRKIHAHWDASAFVPFEATRRQWFLGAVGPKLQWTYILSPKMTVDASFSRGGFWWPGSSYTEDVRRTDLTTGQTRGMWGADYSRSIRWVRTGNWSWFTDVGRKNHEIKSGYLGWWNKQYNMYFGYRNQQVYRYRSLPGEKDYFLHPNSVQVFDFPSFNSSLENYNSWYINDKVKWNRKLTVNIGIRFDRTATSLPEQGNPGTGPFATRITYPERHDFPVYNSWVPRFSMVYDLTGNGRLALKAGYGRYAIAGPGAAAVNPAQPTTWTYSNWGGSIPYVPRTQDLASVAGGGAGGIRRLDSNLKVAHMNEYTAGIELGLRRDYVLRFNVIRKMDYGGSKTLDLAQPYSAFTDVVYATDPGRDNIAGTADDRVMQTWSVPRSYPTFGRINSLITNVDKNEGNKLYTAYDSTFNKQFSNGWSLMVSYAVTFAKLRTIDPQNPNELLYRAFAGLQPGSFSTNTPATVRYNWELPDWYQIVRTNGTYALPLGLKYAATYNAQSGEYYPRVALMRNALNSIVGVPVEGRAGRYNWVKMWDNRISKTFRINDRHSVESMFDVFNTLNTNVVLSQVNTNGPDYLKPFAQAGASIVPMPIIPPRVFRLGMRWKF